MRVESALSSTYSKISDSSVKFRKWNVYHPKNRSKQTCIIHGPGHSSDECKVLGDFGYRYSKIRPTKDHSNERATIIINYYYF